MSTAGDGRFEGSDAQAAEAAEFVESLHPALSRALLYVVLAFVLAGLLWAGLGKVDAVATAPFRLVPLGQVSPVQTPRGGEIEQIAVEEGGRVGRGQVLFRLRSRETWVALRELEQARVAFERADYDLREAFPQKRRLAQETVVALESRLRLTQAVIRAHREAVEACREGDQEGQGEDDGLPEAGLEAEIRLGSAEMEHLKRQYADSRQLYERRLISRAALEEARARYLGALAALPSRMAEVHRLETTAQDLRRQILEAQVELGRESARAAHAYEEARLRYARARQAAGRGLAADSDLIFAPEAGVVTQVFVNTVGQVVSQGQTLATLAPASAPLVAEAMISGRDVGLIRPGQAVKLKYEAFPFGEYGIRRGRLLRVSPDAVADPALGPVYRGLVELEEVTVRVGGEERPLMYGMKGTAEVITDRRSILSLLLRPLRELRESIAFSPNGN
jgi:hemolysin D